MIKGYFIDGNTVTGTEIRLNNNQYLRSRNALNTGDINILRVNASNQIEFSSIPYVVGLGRVALLSDIPDITALQNQVNQIQTDLNSLTSTVNGLVTDVNTLETIVSGLVNDVNALEITVSGLVTDVITLEGLQSSYLLLDGTRAMTGNLNLSNYKIINLSNPINPQDAVNKQYLETAIAGITSNIKVNQNGTTIVSNIAAVNFTGNGVVVTDAGSGIANVAINIPTDSITNGANLGLLGEGVFAQKTGNTLEFKKLIAGANVSLTSDANSITISSSGGSASIVDYVQFNLTPTGVPTTTGVLFWDQAAGHQTLSLNMEGGSVVQQIGQQFFIRVKATAPITKGKVVMITGTVGTSGTYEAQHAVGVTDGNVILGVAAENIAFNDFGYIAEMGDVRNIITDGTPYGETWSDGDELYWNPNPAYPGGLTNVKPSAPNVKASIGSVMKASNGMSGSIYVRLNPGSILGGTDSNVQFGTLNNNDFIVYNSVLGYWENITLAQAQSLIGGGYITGAQNTSGSGEGLFKQKTGSILEFKKIAAGDNVTLVSGPDSVTINAGLISVDKNGTNIVDASTLNFVGSNIDITAGANIANITISNGPVSVEGVEIATTLASLDFTGFGVSASSDLNGNVTVTIPGLTVGTSESISTLNFITSNVTVDQSSADTVDISISSAKALGGYDPGILEPVTFNTIGFSNQFTLQQPGVELLSVGINAGDLNITKDDAVVLSQTVLNDIKLNFTGSVEVTTSTPGMVDINIQAGSPQFEYFTYEVPRTYTGTNFDITLPHNPAPNSLSIYLLNNNNGYIPDGSGGIIPGPNPYFGGDEAFLQGQDYTVADNTVTMIATYLNGQPMNFLGSIPKYYSFYEYSVYKIMIRYCRG